MYLGKYLLYIIIKLFLHIKLFNFEMNFIRSFDEGSTVYRTIFEEFCERT